MTLNRIGAACLLIAGCASATTLPRVTEGTLLPVDPYSSNTGIACPLKHTAVEVEITGFLARVTVTQEFRNDSGRITEAVYAFPLPVMAAVDRMEMRIGDRTVRAVIKRRDEARRLFEQARQQGNTAALLEQNRPNIFTQSVTNIAAGATVKVTLSYVETLKYEEGSYEWSFPMVVGPRYKPDPSFAHPKYAPPETRAGHDLSLSLKLDSGVPIDALRSSTHEIAIERPARSRAAVRLAAKSVIPNKDFVLRYDVAGAKIEDAVLAHRAERGGFFTLILQPPERVTVEDVTPKELVFVLDTSGSMSGFPIEKAKETMRLAMAGLYPRDTFNFITFAGDTHVLFPQPVPATPENVRRAQEFLESRRGGGGTEMMKAIRAALAPSANRDAVRVVCFMTDGYIGNDDEIIDEIRRNPGARIFSFGIGGSVNRYLLDKMAEAGRGAVEYVGLKDDGSAAARRFHERVRNPLLTDVRLEWGNLPVSDIYPQRVPDLFSAKPVIVHGRYSDAATGIVRLRGRMSGREITREVRVQLPGREPAHDVLATLWARTQIDHLSRERNAETETRITELGLRFSLMTQFTAFIAVDLQSRVEGGKPVVVEVPVEMPDGVSHQGVFGARNELAAAGRMKSYAAPATADFRQLRTLAEEPEAKKPAKVLPSLRNASTPTVTVEIWLNDASPAVVEKLKKLGFVATAAPRVAKVLIGTFPSARLRDLELMPEVFQVLPHHPR